MSIRIASKFGSFLLQFNPTVIGFSYQQNVRRRRTSLTTRSTQVQRPRPVNDASDEENNEFSV